MHAQIIELCHGECERHDHTNHDAFSKDLNCSAICGEFLSKGFQEADTNMHKRLCYCRGTARRATSFEILWPFFD